MQLIILKFLLNFFSAIYSRSKYIIAQLKEAIFFYELEDRDNDIYIMTYPKSGTTWMQVILHNIVGDGNMDFDHIYKVSPWLSNMIFKGEDPKPVNELPSPRYFKSHDQYEKFQKGFTKKIIYVYRDGKDVAESYYHHNKNFLNPDLTFDDNFENHFSNMSKPLNWFKFNQEWMENSKGLNIHYVAYEDLKKDFDHTVKKIAHFLEVELTSEKLERTKKYASFDYMKAHESKFGEKAPEKKPLVFDQFIREGESGKGKSMMNEEQLKIYETYFDQHLKNCWPKNREQKFISIHKVSVD